MIFTIRGLIHNLRIDVQKNTLSNLFDKQINTNISDELVDILYWKMHEEIKINIGNTIEGEFRKK